jgi:hypothetical protein
MIAKNSNVVGDLPGMQGRCNPIPREKGARARVGLGRRIHWHLANMDEVKTSKKFCKCCEPSEG